MIANELTHISAGDLHIVAADEAELDPAIGSLADALYDERADLDLPPAFIEDVKQRGILKPVLAVWIESADQWVVVDGRQRVRAARLIDEAMPVPVRAINGSAAELFATTIAANEHRIADSEETRARKAARLRDLLVAGGASRTEAWERVAQAFGRSTEAVRLWVRYLEAEPEVRQLAEQGLITATDAARTSTLDRDEAILKAQAIADQAADKPATRSPRTKRAAKATTWTLADARRAARLAVAEATARTEPLAGWELACWGLLEWVLDTGGDPDLISDEHIGPASDLIVNAVRKVRQEKAAS